MYNMHAVPLRQNQLGSLRRQNQLFYSNTMHNAPLLRLVMNGSAPQQLVLSECMWSISSECTLGLADMQMTSNHDEVMMLLLSLLPIRP